MMSCIRKIGIDPGSVNFAISDIRFRGFRYNANRTEQIPVFEPLHMEVWNLKTGIGIRHSETTPGTFETFHVPESRETPAPTIDSWTASLNHFITCSPWIFEREEDGSLPSVTVENQFDHIKNQGQKYDMFLISNVFATSIHMADLQHYKQTHPEDAAAHQFREMAKSSSKYGMAQDGSRDHQGNKEECIAIIRRLLKLLGPVGRVWLAYLDDVKAEGQKIDDLCDSLSLALQKAINEYEKAVKLAKKNGTYVESDDMTTTGLREVPYGQVNYKVFDNTTYPKLLVSRVANENGEMIDEFECIDLDDSDLAAEDAEETAYLENTKKKKKRVAKGKKGGPTANASVVAKRKSPKTGKAEKLVTDSPSPKKKRAPRKKKAPSESDEDEKPKKRKASTPRKRKPTTEEDDDDDTVLVPSSPKRMKLNPLTIVELNDL